jgi:nitrogen regulatory protein PII-like uncharacterized protein
MNKGMVNENSYIKKIRRVIQSCDNSVSAINDLEYIKIINYTEDNNKLVVDMINSNKIHEIEKLQSDKLGSENLVIMKFTDQNGISRVVTLYDSDDLWQDPRVIEIYSL